jgi:hypothetical protein
MTVLTTCNGSGNIRDLKVGDEVSLQYQVKGDEYVAQNIVQSGGAGAMMLACR